MDVSALQAAQGYAATRGSAPPDLAEAGSTAAGYVRDFAQTLRDSEETAVQAMTGKADPQALVQALAETQLAVETAVTVRDRVVEAYQEILRMPV
ncbi:MAG: flagellar hook-basal body complex protein FliE [Pseudomonadota bacterium]